MHQTRSLEKKHRHSIHKSPGDLISNSNFNLLGRSLSQGWLGLSVSSELSGDGGQRYLPKIWLSTHQQFSKIANDITNLASKFLHALYLINTNKMYFSEFWMDGFQLCRAWKVGEKHENWRSSRNFLNSKHLLHDALRLVEKILNIQNILRNGLYSLRYRKKHSGALKMAATVNFFENSNNQRSTVDSTAVH